MKLQSQSTSEFLINKSIKRQISFDSIFDGKMFGSCDDVWKDVYYLQQIISLLESRLEYTSGVH